MPKTSGVADAATRSLPMYTPPPTLEVLGIVVLCIRWAQEGSPRLLRRSTPGCSWLRATRRPWRPRSTRRRSRSATRSARGWAAASSRQGGRMSPRCGSPPGLPSRRLGWQPWHTRTNASTPERPSRDRWVRRSPAARPLASSTSPARAPASPARTGGCADSPGQVWVVDDLPEVAIHVLEVRGNASPAPPAWRLNQRRARPHCVVENGRDLISGVDVVTEREPGGVVRPVDAETRVVLEELLRPQRQLHAVGQIEERDGTVLDLLPDDSLGRPAQPVSVEGDRPLQILHRQREDGDARFHNLPYPGSRLAHAFNHRAETLQLVFGVVVVRRRTHDLLEPAGLEVEPG